MPDAKAKDGAGAPLPDAAGPSDDASPSYLPSAPADDLLDDTPYLDSPAGIPDSPPPRYTDLPPEPAPEPNPLAPRHRAPPRPARCIGSRGKGSGNERYMDPRLDSDPSYLSAWMTHLSAFPPRFFVRLEGTHRETRNSDRRNKSETRDVTDFDLELELTPFLYSDVKNRSSWMHLRTVEDHEVVRRGTSLRSAVRSEGPEVGSAKPSLAEWAARYCASRAGLKTFVLRREISGFDERYVRERVAAIARETGYRGTVRVSFPVLASRATVYSSCRVNELRLTRWVRWLFYLTLLFLVVWPYLFLRTKRFEVLVADWPFSRYNEEGEAEYVSVSEETWVNVWSGAIRRGVLGRRRGVVDQRDIGEGPNREVVRGVVEGMEVVQREYGWGYDT